MRRHGAELRRLVRTVAMYVLHKGAIVLPVGLVALDIATLREEAARLQLATYRIRGPGWGRPVDFSTYGPPDNHERPEPMYRDARFISMLGFRMSRSASAPHAIQYVGGPNCIDLRRVRVARDVESLLRDGRFAWSGRLPGPEGLPALSKLVNRSRYRSHGDIWYTIWELLCVARDRFGDDAAFPNDEARPLCLIEIPSVQIADPSLRIIPADVSDVPGIYGELGDGD